jgi:hypothetical protein
MIDIGHGAWSYLFMFVAGFCATHIWRYMGAVLSRGIAEDSEILFWVRAVSTALVAGLVARMILLPAGALAEVPVAIRFAAFGAGLGAYFLTGRRLLVGVFGGAAALVAVQYLVNG